MSGIETAVTSRRKPGRPGPQPRIKLLQRLRKIYGLCVAALGIALLGFAVLALMTNADSKSVAVAKTGPARPAELPQIR